MPSDRLFGPSLATETMAAAVSDVTWVRTMLEVEAAVAEAEAAAGVIPADAASAIATACAGEFDVAAIGREAGANANPVIPLVKALRAAVPADAAEHVHHGITSQDVLDTAMMLISRRAIALLLEDTRALADACASLAEKHRATPTVARTLLQQAVPTTFGMKAAGWLEGVVRAAEHLRQTQARCLAVQLGGAAGTLASLGDRGLAVLGELARRLELPEPALPWHAERSRVAELASALAISAGVAGKIALDLLLLSQSEVGEVAEVSPGSSSAMRHKRNPVASIEARTALQLLQPQIEVLFRAMQSEHERAAGAWQAEWPALSEAFRLSAGVISRTRAALDGLTVDEARMAANLEAWKAEVEPHHDLRGYVGSTEQWIDRTLADYRKWRAAA